MSRVEGIVKWANWPIALVPTVRIEGWFRVWVSGGIVMRGSVNN